MIPSSQTKTDGKDKRTVPTETVNHGPDETKILVPFVEPVGSVVTAVGQQVFKMDCSEFVKVTKKSKDVFKQKHAVTIGVGLAKNEFRSKTTQ